jgi:16S rRNA (cytosine967-C5)-methyltransferase
VTRENGRRVAIEVLVQVLKHGRSLTLSLEENADPLPAPRERALAKELSIGVVRWLPRLEAVLHALLERPLHRKNTDVRAMLLLGLYQLMYTRIPAHAAVAETVALAQTRHKSWAKGLINRVLRTFQRDREQLLAQLERQPEAAFAHPGWLIDMIRSAWPKDWTTILYENNRRPPMTLRVNARLSTRAHYIALVREAAIEARVTPYTTHGVTLDRPMQVHQLPGFHEGWVSVQDGAAQLAPTLLSLAQGQRVLDACAAPGSKTAHLLEAEPQLTHLLAVDRDCHRLVHLQHNLKRAGLKSEVVCGDSCNPLQWWDGRPFDRILLDAPCSATGVIRRHADIKLHRRPGDIERSARLQAQLLEALWPLLAPAGRLLYATCSILPCENAQTIQRFLDQHRDAQERPISAPWGRAMACGRQILPGENEMDGFFYAILEKGG